MNLQVAVLFLLCPIFTRTCKDFNVKNEELVKTIQDVLQVERDLGTIRFLYPKSNKCNIFYKDIMNSLTGHQDIRIFQINGTKESVGGHIFYILFADSLDDVK